ncbi:MAG: hypothetical protein EBR09_03230 [Proteobacteria bacterium]|nr:hypothetical protein [Pseudomonadota bacterium]
MVVSKPVLRSIFVSIFVSALAACSGAQNSNELAVEALGQEDDLALSSDEYIANLSDDDEDLDSLGLKGKRATPPSPKKREAQQRAVVKAKEARQATQARRVEAKQKAQEASKKVIAARKDLNAARKEAQEARKKAQTARKNAIEATRKAKRVAAAERVRANKAKRQSNLSAAVEYRKKVKALPDNGILQAKAKCDAISEAVSFIKNTNQPPRPFDGKRNHFLASLRTERNKVLRKNGFVDCKSVTAAIASLPKPAPAAVEPADQAIATVDIEDQMPVEVADVVEPVQEIEEIEEVVEVPAVAEPAVEDPAVANPEVVQPAEGEVAAVEGAAKQ